MSLFEYFQRHTRPILFTIAVLTVSGIALMIDLPVSLFPDITFPRIVILADNNVEPAETMMAEVTTPLEEVAGTLPDVRLVRSITSRGSSEISISLAWGADVQQTLQLLQGRIANVRNSLPASASIRAEQMSVSVFPILGYSLTSDSVDLVALRDLALYRIRPALLRVPGVARVEIVGGDKREFLVDVAPDRLAAYHLDIQRVTDAIRKTNIYESTGLIDNNRQLYLSLVSGLLASQTDIESVIVAVQNGVPIRVADVARVMPSVADSYIRTTARGRDAVLINIVKQPVGSTVRIGEDVAAEIAALTLPGGVRFENFYDQGDFIRTSILGTRDSILLGILLAMIVIFAFLRSGRTTLVIVLVVPATIAATFACLAAAGKTINIMTLGGIAAAVGLIIDDSIVVIENIFSRFGTERRIRGSGIVAFSAMASKSIRELMPAILGSTASTIVIHIPLAFMGGVTGAFFASLSLTMVFALSISFIFSIALAPLLASLLLKEKDIAFEVKREAHTSSLARWYQRVLRALLRRRLFFIPAAIAIVAVTYWLYSGIGSSFMPDMDEGTFVLDYWSPPGTSLSETHRILGEVEKILMRVPEVESYSRRTGTELGFFLTEPNTGDFLIKLKSRRKRGIEEVIADVRRRVEAAQPNLRIEFGQLMMDVIGDLTNDPSPIEIKLFGDDQRSMQATAREVKRLIETVPGVVDASDGIVISGPSFIVHVDAAKASLAGFSAADVRSQIDALMSGDVESTIQKGEKLIPIHVRYPAAYRTDMTSIEGLRLVNAASAQVPLSSIATVERTAGQAEIHRERLRPMVAVTARLSGRDLGRTIADVRKLLSSRLALPRGVTLEYGGLYQTQQESFQGLFLVAIAAFALVFIVLLFEFGEFAVPVSIFVINVLSLLGVFGALWLTGVTFNISSFVGIIMIIGIVAENSIFVLHTVKAFQAEGSSLDDALVKASLMRARPIIMTTLAAVLALLPLSIGIGAGARMQQPLAVAVIGGFSLSSFLLFFGLPVIYRLLRPVRDLPSPAAVSADAE
jgi:CzcA family heavy metal efflux pump